jgi:class 3 adenylate cyclase
LQLPDLVLSIATVTLAFLAVVVSVLAWRSGRQARRQVAALTPDSQKLLTAWRDLTPEQVAEALAGYLESVSNRLANHEQHLERLQARSERMMTHRGLVRFDNDAEIKGRLSFCLVLLDDQLDGFLLTSLYNLTGNRIFLRSVQRGQVEHDMLSEEAQALRQACGEGD